MSRYSVDLVWNFEAGGAARIELSEHAFCLLVFQLRPKRKLLCPDHGAVPAERQLGCRAGCSCP
jgi:hypothetical protein